MVKNVKAGLIVKVGIYLRKSRAEDGTQDLQKHKEYLISICNREGWLYDLYEEIDSSQDIHRAELQRLRKDIQLGKIDAVMVNAVDRLSRKARHFLEIIEDYFLDEGMTILFEREVRHNLLDTTTITMLQIKATLSQAEYSFIVQRLLQGRKSSAKKGVWSGKLIYGYEFDKENQKIVTVESEKPVVRMICDLTLEGFTYGAICKELTRLGYRTRKGNEFDVHNIKSIVHSPFIRGHVVVNWNDGEETVVKDNHEAIITDAEYQKMKEILDKRTEQYTNVSVAPKHFLQGLLRCSKCGIVSVVQANKESKYKEGIRTYGDYVYYVRKCRGKGCENYGCNVGEVEDILVEILKEYSSMVADKIRMLKQVNQVEITKGHSDKIKELEKAIKKLETKEESLLDLLLEGTITKDVYNKRMESLKEDKASILTELESLSSVVVDVELESKHATNTLEMIEAYEGLEGEDKRRLLQLVFAEMKYTKSSKKGTPVLDVVPN